MTDIYNGNLPPGYSGDFGLDEIECVPDCRDCPIFENCDMEAVNDARNAEVEE